MKGEIIRYLVFDGQGRHAATYSSYGAAVMRAADLARESGKPSRLVTLRRWGSVKKKSTVQIMPDGTQKVTEEEHEC